MEWEYQIRGLNVIHDIYHHARAPQRTATLINNYGPDASDESVKIDGLNTSEGAVISRDAGVTRVFVAGIKGRLQAITVALGYGNRNRALEHHGFNSAFYIDARNIWLNNLRNVLRPGDRVELHGHSAGGGICEVLAQIIRVTFPATPINIDTYGCPAPAIEGYYASGRLVSRRRWMLINDPVPLIPWVQLPGLHFLALFTADQLLSIGRGGDPQPWLYRQPPEGRRLSMMGVQSAHTPLMTVNPQRQVLDWLHGIEAPLDFHDADSYRIMFENVPAPATEEIVATAGFSIINGVPEVTTNVVMPFVLPTARESGVVMPILITPTGIALDDQGRTVGSFIVREGRRVYLKINRRNAFKKIKVGNKWQVLFNGVPVLMTDEPRQPGAVVRRGNAFLSSIGTHNQVAVAAFVEAFAAWCNSAASDTSYAKPPLRIWDS